MKTGVVYAKTEEGVELAVIDVTNPAFRVTATDAELAAMAEQYILEAGKQQQVPEALREGAGQVGWDGEQLGLLGAQPARGVFDRDAEPRGVGAVGAAAVPERTDVEHGGPGGHLRGDHRGGHRRPVVEVV